MVLSRNRLGAVLYIVLLLLSSIGCSISDEKVEEEIEKRGGTIITGPVTLGGEPGVVVQPRENLGSASIEIIASMACRKWCYQTVGREYIDGKPEIPPELDSELHEKASVDGYFVDNKSSPGRGKGSSCDKNKERDNYHDAPNFPDSEFGSYFDLPLIYFERVYVLEQETCISCLDPPTGILGCVKWYYVKVKQDDPHPPITKLVTTGGLEPEPSDNFKRAVESYEDPSQILGQ